MQKMVLKTFKWINIMKEFSLESQIQQKLKDTAQFKQALIEKSTAQEVLEISDPLMAKLYQVSCHLFEQKRYEDAAHAFLFLATLNSHNHDYWVGLGMSTQLCHAYETAIDAYELAALCDISSPVPYFYLAKCLFAIHDRESALQALDLAIETAGDIEEYAELKQQAEMAKEVLLKHQ